MERFARSCALLMTLTLAALPSASLLCCAWAGPGDTPASAAACEHAAPPAAARAASAAFARAEDCAPATLDTVFSLPDGSRWDAPMRTAEWSASPLTSAASETRRLPASVPASHVPKHLLFAVLLV